MGGRPNGGVADYHQADSGAPGGAAGRQGWKALPQPGKAAPQITPMGEVERLGDAARKSARATGLVSPRREVQV